MTRDGIARACDGSLARLGTDHLDLYLLHWRSPDADLSAVVAAFESLRAARKIRAWGVSNFKVSDMEDLFSVPDGHRCATNQVRYSLDSRGIERDLLPWCEQRGMPVMAYSPLGGDSGSLVRDPTLARIGAAHGCSSAAVALAWAIRSGNVPSPARLCTLRKTPWRSHWRSRRRSFRHRMQRIRLGRRTSCGRC